MVKSTDMFGKRNDEGSEATKAVRRAVASLPAEGLVRSAPSVPWEAGKEFTRPPLDDGREGGNGSEHPLARQVDDEYDVYP